MAGSSSCGHFFFGEGITRITWDAQIGAIFARLSPGQDCFDIVMRVPR